MIIQILGSLYICGVLGILWWIIDPLFEKKNDNLDQVKIKDNGGKYSFKDYQQQSKRPIELSIVVPNFSPNLKLPFVLIRLIESLEDFKVSYEIIIVNDQSSDRNMEEALKFAQIDRKSINLKIVESSFQQTFLKIAVSIAQGNQILILKSQANIDIQNLSYMIQKLENQQHGIVFGYTKLQTINNLSFYDIKGHIHNILSYLLSKFMEPNIQYMLITKISVKLIYQNMQLDNSSSNAEILLLAKKFGIPEKKIIVETISYNLTNDIKNSLIMIRDSLLINCFYYLGIWKVKI